MKKILCVAAVLFSSHLIAQDSTITSLDEVTVTATRFSKKISETGKVVTIISRKELERQGGKDISQILTEQAGLVINGATSNPGKDKSVYMRGAKTNYTLILINGIPVTDPTGIGGAFDLRQLPIEQVERIEILKGAQSTLYGPDAVAGVINIITHKGEGKPIQFFGGASAGNYSTLKANAGINGVINGHSYNLMYTHNETKGVPEAEDTTRTQAFPKNGYSQNAISFDASIRLVKGLYLKPFFRNSHYNGTYANGAFSPGNNLFKSDMIHTGSQLQYQLLKGTITGLYSYQDVKRNYVNSFGSSQFDGDNKIAEVFGHYDLSDHLQLLGGYQFARQKMFNPNETVKDTSVTLNSPYLSLYLKNLSGFNVEAGVRLNMHSSYGEQLTYSFNPSYLWNEKIKLFVNIGSAFKTPALSELFGQWGANPDLKPEESYTIEAGVHSYLFNKKHDIRFVYFDRSIKNVIIYNANFTYENFDQQNDRGFEIEPSFQITDDLRLKLSYAYVTGKVTTQSNGKDTVYNNLIRRPKNVVAANLDYQVTPRLFFNTSFQNYGKRNDLFFNSSTFMTEAVALSSYSLWNTYTEYSFPKPAIKIFAQVNNILNKDYSEIYGYTTLGTNFSGGFRIKL